MARARRSGSAIVLAAAVALVLTACSGGGARNPSTQGPAASTATRGAAPSSTAGHQIVTITDSGFSPASVTVKAGTRVVWTNSSKAVRGVTLGAGQQSAPIQPGGIASHVFSAPGEFPYHDSSNPAFQGVVIVR
jgi:plastocyanin